MAISIDSIDEKLLRTDSFSFGTQSDIYLFSNSPTFDEQLVIPLDKNIDSIGQSSVRGIQVEINFDEGKFQPIIQIAPSHQHGIVVYTSKGTKFKHNKREFSFSKNKHNGYNYSCYHCFKIAKKTQLPEGMDIMESNDSIKKTFLYFKKPTTIDYDSLRYDSIQQQLLLQFEPLNKLCKSDGYVYLPTVEIGFDMNANVTQKMAYLLSASSLNLGFEIQLQLNEILTSFKDQDFPPIESIEKNARNQILVIMKKHLLGEQKFGVNFNHYYINRLNEYINQIEKTL